MMAQKSKAVDGLTRGIVYLFKKYGVTHEIGVGTITGPNSVKVIGQQGEKVLNTKNILIATGSEVASLPGLTVSSRLSKLIQNCFKNVLYLLIFHFK